MKFEFVEFYPNSEDLTKIRSKGIIIGSAHIYAYEGDVQLDIRGVLVIKVKDKFVMRMPCRTVIDPETKMRVTYPIFAFSKAAHGDALFAWLKTTAVDELKKIIKKNKITEKSVKEMGGS